MNDLDFLVSETFKNQIEQNATLDLPNSPGIFYRILQNASTFSLKTLVSPNLSCDWSEKSHEFLTDSPESLFWFATEYIELAEVLSDQVRAKRFARSDESFYNLSDPGLCWWVSLGKDYLKLHFKKSFLPHADTKVENIGPLCDSLVAHQIFARNMDIFYKLLPLSDYSCDEGQAVFRCMDPSDENFSLFLQLFLSGREDFAAKLDSYSPSLSLFFKEMAVVRRFWLELEKHLSSDQELE